MFTVIENDNQCFNLKFLPILDTRHLDITLKTWTWVLRVRDTPVERGTELPGDVQLILDEFAYVMPDELPEGLPPLRDIQQAIDLVLNLQYLTFRPIR